MLFRSVLTLLQAAVLLTCGAPVLAQDALALILSDQAGQVVAEYDLADLDAMPQTEFTTTTIWTEGPVTFTGVTLATVLDAAGLRGASVSMTALNDYSVDIPMDEITETAPLLATRMDGEVMSVRDRGPYWIVYDYDADPAFQTETNYARSIWQLNRLRTMD